jgi:sugar lactone lactonase YvrE
MRRIVVALLILILPTTAAIIVYLIVNKKIPTNREAIGRVTLIAGTGQPGVDNRAGLQAALSVTFSDPFGVAVDKRGNLFVSDAGQSNRIREIHTDGKVETIAGSTEGFADGNAAQSRFNTPSGIVIDASGNLFVADTSNNRVRKIDNDRKVTTLAGSGNAGFKDGIGSDADFDGPLGIAIDKRGVVIVADAYNDRIRKVNEDGLVTTIAGTGSPGFADGDPSTARFNTPSGVAVDDAGNIFVADTGNSAIRKITTQGEVSTVIRNRQEQDGNSLSLRHPVGIAITHDGFLFVTHDHGVLKITPDGVASAYAGGAIGFSDGVGGGARFNGPAGIAIDREGHLIVADTHNYLIREIAPEAGRIQPATSGESSLFIQPGGEAGDSSALPMIPKLDASVLGVGAAFPWPLPPQGEAHEVTGVIGEARGAPGGIALDHLHSGLDVRGDQGDPVLSVLDEKVSSPIANWDYGGSGEGIQIGAMSYIHVRIGRNVKDEIQSPDRFRLIKPDDANSEVRMRRGTRFKVGDFIGTVNRLYHVHLNLGPWSAQTNPLVLPFANLKDTTPPTIEPNGIQIVNTDGKPFTRKLDGRTQISGDVRILVSAYDRVDGNAAKRKLGLFRLGYQVLNEDGTPATGFDQPLINIQFDRLPPDDSSVLEVYASGSGVSAYGTPTEFKYMVTNRVRDGEARSGLLRTSKLQPGNYLIRIIADDYAGNRASGASSQMAVTVVR